LMRLLSGRVEGRVRGQTSCRRSSDVTTGQSNFSLRLFLRTDWGSQQPASPGRGPPLPPPQCWVIRPKHALGGVTDGGRGGTPGTWRHVGPLLARKPRRASSLLCLSFLATPRLLCPPSIPTPTHRRTKVVIAIVFRWIEGGKEGAWCVVRRREGGRR